MEPLSRIYTTCSSQEEAFRLLTPLVEEGLVACISVTSCTSVYRWNKQLEKSEEVGCTLEVLPKHASQVISWLETHHPYEIPIITLTESIVNNGYRQWMEQPISSSVDFPSL